MTNENVILNKTVKVRNMVSSKNGKEVPNQFVITVTTASGDDVEYFQSYKSVIVRKEYGAARGRITLDRNKWDYSKTTGKYRNDFLGESKAETERKIKAGVYTLADLN